LFVIYILFGSICWLAGVVAWWVGSCLANVDADANANAHAHANAMHANQPSRTNRGQVKPTQQPNIQTNQHLTRTQE